MLISENIQTPIGRDGVVVLDIDHGSMLGFTPIGALIWEKINDGISAEQIAGSIAIDFQIPPEQALADVREFVLDLRSKGLLSNTVGAAKTGMVSSIVKKLLSVLRGLLRFPISPVAKVRWQGSTKQVSTISTSSLVLKAYLKLILFDLFLLRGNFKALYRKVRSHPVGLQNVGTDTAERICAAVDMACIWYWKEALCLQRSAVTACLLKQFGVPAKLVIGAQQMPFKSHAWVEVDGRIVNDKPYMKEIYAVLDRC